MMRKFSAVAASIAMLMSSTLAFADEQQQPNAQEQGALAPGKPAGVEKAVGEDTNIALIVVGLGVVAGGVALALGGSGGSNSSTSTNP